MKRRLPGLRLGVFLLLILGILSPVVAANAGAQAFTCDDFNSSAAAQAVLDADPTLEDVLDADGDGIACNEDAEETPGDEEETPADDVPGGDSEAYLADIQDEVDSVVESFDRYVEINLTFADATDSEQQELVLELQDLATSWSEYPDVAAEFEAPADLEDVSAAYLDFADMVGETGDLWLDWWAIPQGDPEEDAAFDDFTTSFDDTYAAAEDVTAAIEDAGGSTTPTDPTEEATEPAGDAEDYLADVEDNAATWSESADRALELFEQATGTGLSDAEIDEFSEIIDAWAAAPDTAAELEAPEGYEDVQNAYLDLADEYAAAADAFSEWSQTDTGSPEEADAEDVFLDTIDSALALTEDVEIAIEDAGGSTTPSDDPTEEPNDPSGNVDAEEYLATVSENANDWNDSIVRFSEIVALGADMTDAELTEVTEIVTSWLVAPVTASELEVPEGMEDVQAAYEDYADELASASGFFFEWAEDPESAAGEDALSSFDAAIEEAQTLFDELDGLLSDATP